MTLTDDGMNAPGGRRRYQRAPSEDDAYDQAVPAEVVSVPDKQSADIDPADPFGLIEQTEDNPGNPAQPVEDAPGEPDTAPADPAPTGDDNAPTDGGDVTAEPTEDDSA